MIKQERISRYNRRRNFAPLKFFLISALSLTLIGIIAYKITKPKAKEAPQVVATEPKPKIDLGRTADSVITACCNSFYLNKSSYIESTRSQTAGIGGSSYHRYYQEWPQEIPLLEFANRLNKMASDADLDCGCEESIRNNWMECSLKVGSRIGAGVHLQAGIDANLVGRDIAFILDNFRALKNEDVTLLIKNGVTFSYITSADYFPTSEMRKLMARGNVSPILRLPTIKDGWIMLGQNLGVGRKSSKKKPVFDSGLVDDVLSHQPDAKLFVFDSTSAIDEAVISTVLKRANSQKMSYLRGLYGTNRIDSLVLLSSAKIMEVADGKDIPVESIASLKFKLYNELLSPESGQQRLTFYLEMTNIPVANLWNLRYTLNSIGVRIRPLMKMVTPFERL
jgi:hypothetical protein